MNETTKSILDIISAVQIGKYWNALNEKMEYHGNALFPNKRVEGLKVGWAEGMSGLPVVLAASDLDTDVTFRDREQYKEIEKRLPIFREAYRLTEEEQLALRRIRSGGTAIEKDIIIGRLYNDRASLIRGSLARREHMRMQILSTGVFVEQQNGRNIMYDYGYDSHNFADAAVSWVNHATSTPLIDIIKVRREVKYRTGADLTLALCTPKTFTDLAASESLSKALNPLVQAAVPLSDEDVLDFVKKKTGVTIKIVTGAYTKTRDADTGTGELNVYKMMDDDIFVMCPAMPLGNTANGITPEENELMSDPCVDVSVVEDGIAICNKVKDSLPVTIWTWASMLSLPTFEQRRNVVVLDTNP